MDCKFAILAIPQKGWFPELNANEILGNNLLLLADPESFLKRLPDEHWRKWLGTIEWENLTKTKMIVLSWCPTQTPEVLDHEDKGMEDLLSGAVYSALMLTAPFPGTGGTPIVLSGSGKITDDAVTPLQVRSHSPLRGWIRSGYSGSKQMPFFWQWMEAKYPLPTIISEWSTLIVDLQQLPQDSTTYLYRMALSIFGQALSDPWLDFKFPNFVRSIETLIAIPKTAILKKTYGGAHTANIEFQKRICRFYPQSQGLFFSMTAKEVATRAEEIYQLRSDSVHGKPLAWTLKQQNPNFTDEELFRYEFMLKRRQDLF